MVNIIINELKDKDLEDTSKILIEDDDLKNIKLKIEENKHINIYNRDNIKYLMESQKELKSMINDLMEENKKLNGEVEDLKNHITKMNKSTNRRLINLNKTQLNQNDLEKLIDEKIGETKKEKTTITTAKRGKAAKRGKSIKDTDIFYPNKHVSRKWENLTLCDDGSIINKGLRTFKLPIDLNALLYFIECDNPFMNRKRFKKLKEDYHINVTIMGKIIYNIRNNCFDNVIATYNEKLSKADFNISVNNTILINGVDSLIKKDDAYSWIRIMMNINNRQEKILELQKTNHHIDKDYVRIICDSYDNDKLLKITKPKSVDEFIENNPSKRRNILAQGGLM